MLFENYRKSLILQHCERSELRLHKEPKNGQFGDFWNIEAWGQTVLQDRKKIVGKCHNWKSSNETFLVIFKHRGQNRVIFQGGNF